MRWRRLDAMRAVMFVSANAVRAFLRAPARAGLLAAAMPAPGRPGPATARMRCCEAGVPAPLRRCAAAATPRSSIPKRCGSRWRARCGAGDRVLVVRGRRRRRAAAATGWPSSCGAAGARGRQPSPPIGAQPPALEPRRSAHARCAARPRRRGLAVQQLARRSPTCERLLPAQDWSQARARGDAPAHRAGGARCRLRRVVESRPAVGRRGRGR